MMKTSLKKLTITALAVTALSVSASVSAQVRSAVTILHGIPGLSVDLVVDGEIVIAGFNAGDTQDLSSLAGMTLSNIEAREPGGGDVVIGPIESFDVPDEGNASVVVHLDADGEPIITSFSNDAPPTDQGRGRLVVRHVAAAPSIEVSLDDVEVLSGIGNGNEAGVDLPAGMIADAWITAGGERIAQLPNLELDANSNLVVYVGGSLGDDTLAFYVQVIAAGQVDPVSDDAGGATDETEPAAETPADEAAVGDGTPQPVVVNTGSLIGADRNDVWLAAALGAALLAMGALVMRRRTA